MQSDRRLILANRAWVKDKLSVKPDYFKILAKDQKPEFLWIGCSDSRVPAEEITGTEPGELFVHRNIANLVIHTDFNVLSVVQYAVEVLKVRHIIVCGHYGCGGVRAALTHQHFGILNKWLRHIKDVYYLNREKFEGISDETARANLMCEINIRAQIYNLAKTHIVQEAWYREKRPILHGWIYGLDNGLIKEICELTPESEMDPIFRFDFSELPKG